MEIVRIWFDFSGRMNRGKYWLVTLLNSIIIVAAILIAIVNDFLPLYVLTGLIVLVLTASVIAAGIKRLHDRNKTGWWLLLFYLVPSALDAAGGLVPEAGFVFGLIVLGISIWALVELGCLRGTIAGNPYGPDPVAPKPAQH
jgi:uncharacterized membrane protein YhaH (DUF805 family)